MRQIILDTETTGLDPKSGHKLVEVAALEMIDRKLTGKHYHSYINPQRDSDERAEQIHGLTRAFLASKPLFSQIAADLQAFVQDAELIIHNASFDMGFLDFEYRAIKMSPLSRVCSNVIDTLGMAKEMFPGKRNNLDALCDRFEINRSGRTLHGALIDCELLAEVYLAMTRGQDSLFAEENNTTNSNSIPTIRSTHQLSVQMANAAEQMQHLAYLQQLEKESKGKCIWTRYTLENNPPV